MSRHVVRCTNSTISEAWAVVSGRPAKHEEGEEILIARTARKRIPELKPQDAVVAVRISPELAAPFWKMQVAWNNGQHLARFGHRYLSVHDVRPEGGRYSTYGEIMEPSLRTWLEIVRDADPDDLGTAPVEAVGFGYVNVFRYGPESRFDLSQYFKLNIGVHVGEPWSELAGFEIALRFEAPATTTHLMVGLKAESPTDEAPITVTTKVYAERREAPDLSWSTVDVIATILCDVKEAAKQAFFDFATDVTHDSMGVVWDAADQP
jgi:hypothetical protein